MFHTIFMATTSDPNAEVSIVFYFLEYQKTSTVFINVKKPVLSRIVTVYPSWSASTNNIIYMGFPIGSAAFPCTVYLAPTEISSRHNL